MEFRTKVDIPKAAFEIPPCEKILLVGSCFADNIGARFKQEEFLATVNPYGVMYNPASIWHTVSRSLAEGNVPNVCVMTLGTNHVYILKATNKIVDNCNKQPQKLFSERLLTVDECAEYIHQSIDALRKANPEVKVIITVSPIRYRKYGYHGSQLSKATLLLAVDKVINDDASISYFPAYEIVNDELRDYRFYRPDMLHPSEQAVEYIWERFCDTYFGNDAMTFMQEWKPIKEALNHRPFNAESSEYQQFMADTQQKLALLKKKYPQMP